jgi:hypothetical protein
MGKINSYIIKKEKFMRNKTLLLPLYFLVLVIIFYSSSCTPQPKIPVAGSARGQDMLTLIPAESPAFLIVNWNKIMNLSLIQKTLKDQYNFNSLEKKIEPFNLKAEKDVYFLALVATDEMKKIPANLALLINLKYQKEKLVPPGSDKNSNLENYQGIPYLPFIEIDGKAVVCVAFLDNSNLALGSEEAIKKIIEVYNKKISNVLKNKNLKTYLQDINKNALTFGLFQLPDYWLKERISQNPSLKLWQDINYISSFSDYRNGSYLIEINIYAKDRSQHKKIAEMLNGFKALGLAATGQVPELGQILDSLEITSTERYVKVFLSLKEDIILKLEKTLKEKSSSLLPHPEKEKIKVPTEKSDKKIS